MVGRYTYLEKIMEQIKSEFNGAIFDRPAGISGDNWKKVEKNLNDTESGRLFRKVNSEAPAAQSESSGKSFAMPQSASIEFSADKAKREKKAAKVAESSTAVE
jgi:hypothetical protein